jgi:hypothetical protein
MQADQPSDDSYSESETVERREKVLKRMLNTPPKPHATHPQSRVRNRKKAGEEKPGHDPEKSDPQ